ncbi:MAG: hypothetical protein WBP59_00100, partial [Ilumatobacteraceae bacterium]
MRTGPHDDGHAAIGMVVIAAALFMALSFGLAELGGRVVGRTRAQTAADAAALASLAGGRSAAAALAAVHG